MLYAKLGCFKADNTSTMLANLSQGVLNLFSYDIIKTFTIFEKPIAFI